MHKILPRTFRDSRADNRWITFHWHQERIFPGAKRYYTEAYYPVVHSRNHRTTQCAAQSYTIMKIEYVLLPFFRSFSSLVVVGKGWKFKHTHTRWSAYGRTTELGETGDEQNTAWERAENRTKDTRNQINFHLEKGAQTAAAQIVQNT